MLLVAAMGNPYVAWWRRIVAVGKNNKRVILKTVMNECA